MDKYIVKQNNNYEEYISTGKITVTVPRTRYSIIHEKSEIRLLDIPDYFRDPLGIANGIVKLLNENKIRLNLEI